MCDTDYTSERSWISPKQLTWEINAALPKDWEESPAGSHSQLVVITGGEPFRQNLRPAIEMLLESNYAVQIETNGTLYQDLPYEDITVVCSPKAGSINKNLAEHITALKYVVSATEVIGVLGADDGLPNNALNHPAAPRLARPPKSFQGPIYIQPAEEQEEVKNHVNTNLAIDSVLKYGYVLQLQTHKIIDME
jgi:organic radical activating enzyme